MNSTIYTLILIINFLLNLSRSSKLQIGYSWLLLVLEGLLRTIPIIPNPPLPFNLVTQWSHKAEELCGVCACVHMHLSFPVSLPPDPIPCLFYLFIPPSHHTHTAPYTLPCRSFCLCSHFLYSCFVCMWVILPESLLPEPFTVSHSVCSSVILWPVAKPWRENCLENAVWTPQQTALQLLLASGNQFVRLM